MKLLCFGAGSIGRRHIKNAMALGHNIVAADPLAAAVPNVVWYSDWRRALSEHGDAAGVIVASPTAAHMEQAWSVLRANLPVYLEKPVCTTEAIGEFASLLYDFDKTEAYLKSVTGLQYFFHPAMMDVGQLVFDCGRLEFSGQDALLDRYGPDVGGIMCLHPLATADRLLGGLVEVDLVTDGTRIRGNTKSMSSGVATYDFDMSAGPRESWVGGCGRRVALEPSEIMYVDCLSAWLSILAGGERDERLSSLDEGWDASYALSKARRVEAMV